jgi:serine/threonine protein kinase
MQPQDFTGTSSQGMPAPGLEHKSKSSPSATDPFVGMEDWFGVAGDREPEPLPSGSPPGGGWPSPSPASKWGEEEGEDPRERVMEPVELAPLTLAGHEEGVHTVVGADGTARTIRYLRSHATGRCYEPLHSLDPMQRQHVQVWLCNELGAGWGVIGQKVIKLHKRGMKEAALMCHLLASNGHRAPVNTLCLEEAFDRDGDVCIVLPFLDGKDLHGYITDYRRLPAWLAVRILRAIARALLDLKRLHTAHMDLSIENVFVTRAGKFVLIDLGDSILSPEVGPRVPHPGRVGKDPYWPPEMFHAQEYVCPFAVDVYALGVILVMMLTGRGPLEGGEGRERVYAGRQREVLTEIFCGRGLDDMEHYPAVLDLLTGMLDPDPFTRPTLEEVWSHDWVESFGRCPLP